MPEIIAGPVVRSRPETRPEPGIERIELLDFDEEGIRLHVRWDIKALNVRDVRLLFSGLESLLNSATRAFLSNDEAGQKLLELVGDSDLLDIEVEQLALGSLNAILRLRSKDIYQKIKESPKVVKEHLKSIAIDKALEEALKGGVHLLVMLMVNFGVMHGETKNPKDISGATGLPEYVITQELKHSEEFLRTLGAPDIPSTLYLDETVRGTKATVKLPLPQEKPSVEIIP